MRASNLFADRASEPIFIGASGVGIVERAESSAETLDANVLAFAASNGNTGTAKNKVQAVRIAAERSSYQRSPSTVSRTSDGPDGADASDVEESTTRRGSSTSAPEPSRTASSPQTFDVLSPPTCYFAVCLALLGVLPNFRWDLLFSTADITPEEAALAASSSHPTQASSDLDRAKDNGDTIVSTSVSPTSNTELGQLQPVAQAYAHAVATEEDRENGITSKVDSVTTPRKRSLHRWNIARAVPLRWHSSVIGGLKVCTYLYSTCVFALLLFLWIRVLQFRNYRYDPVEKIAYGAFYLTPLVALVRGWFVYAYRGDHERCIWDVLDQESHEVRVADRVAALTESNATPATAFPTMDARAPSEEDPSALYSGDGQFQGSLKPTPEKSARRDNFVRVVTATTGATHGDADQSRKRFLSQSWVDMDRRFALMVVIPSVVFWVPTQVHLFRPLVTGVAPSEIDWLVSVAPDQLDKALLDISVSGYCFVLLLGSLYQVACSFVCMGTHIFVSSLLTVRAERLYQDAKRAARLSEAAAVLWMRHVARWRYRLHADVRRGLGDPLSIRWLQFQAVMTAVYSGLFIGLLLYTGGRLPNIVIFLGSSFQLGFLTLQIAVADKGHAVVSRLSARWIMRSNLSFLGQQALPKGSRLGLQQLGQDTVVPDTDANGSPNLPATTVAGDVEVPTRNPMGASRRDVAMEIKRNSTLLRSFGAVGPTALIARLLPAMLLQAIVISIVWIAVIMFRSWINYIECSRDPINKGFLGFDLTRCSAAEFRQISIESGLMAYLWGPIFPAWVAWVLFDMRRLKPIQPFIGTVVVVNTFIFLFAALYSASHGSQDVPWIDKPSIGCYIILALSLALFMKRTLGRSAFFVAGYLLVLVLAAAVRFMHTYVLWFEYVKSDSDRVLVVLLYHPISAMILLSCTQHLTVRLMDANQSDESEPGRWYTIYAALHLAAQITGRFYLFNVSSLTVQVATCIMTNVVDFCLRVTRVWRSRLAWSFVYGPKEGRARARLVQSNAYLCHVQYLTQSLEVMAIFIAFGSALLVRLRYDSPLPLGIVISSFVVQIAVEIFWNSVALLFEISLQGFKNRARLFVEHQAEYYYFWAMLKALILLPVMSVLWVSIIATVPS